jgi:CheY-like chemotaxis protein
MGKSGNIILIEDDSDDKEIFVDIIKDLGYFNNIVWFLNTDDAFHYMKKTDEEMFIIFCDINLPGKTGLELKKEIDRDTVLRRKSIPFVFLSTNTSQNDINTAYVKMTVQGFFKKENNYSRMKDVVKLILDYWSVSKHPNLQ